MSCSRFEFRSKKIGFTSVSYTHLDVYKRQVHVSVLYHCCCVLIRTQSLRMNKLNIFWINVFWYYTPRLVQTPEPCTGSSLQEQMPSLLMSSTQLIYLAIYLTRISICLSHCFHIVSFCYCFLGIIKGFPINFSLYMLNKNNNNSRTVGIIFRSHGMG